jgi:molybdopterin-guanine dinucleotide biosynthesis protein A
VHGFVLAGGKSSRMGMDKATMLFCGRPMIEIAVDKLRSFCAEVSIAGNRDDLTGYAEIVHETRLEIGPAAGVEAGLRAARLPWVIFLPVDVPLMPADVLRRWATATLAMAQGELAATYLLANGLRQPAFCLLRQDCLAKVLVAIEAGHLRLNDLLDAAGPALGQEAAEFGVGGIASNDEVERWFANINTPDDLAKAEAWSQHPTNE